MKKIFVSIAVLAAAAACTERGIEVPAPEIQEGTCALTISIAPDESALTKAPSAYTTAQTYESQVNSVQVFVFDSDGKLNAYAGGGTSLSRTLNVSFGTKDVWAVINAENLSDISTKSELLAENISLDKNSTTASSGFVMAGNAAVTLSGATATVPITVSRLVSRIALVSITNDLPLAYGSVDVVNAFLANVVGNENVNGNASPSTWYNKEGRSDSTPRAEANIINGSSCPATFPTLTYKAVGETVAMDDTFDISSSPYLFYCYRNASTTDPSGFHSSFSAQKTALVVTLRINSVNYYYPVVLSNLERNKSYTVALTVKGLGSNEPDKPISKGSITANITVAGWASGAVYDENI